MTLKRIELRQSGGLAGPTSLKTLMGENLPKPVADEVSHELFKANFFNAIERPIENREPGKDNDLVYEIIVHDDAHGSKTVKVDPNNVEAGLWGLVNYLKKL
jgi:hypothetical protein